MCLLITQSSTSPVINDKWLADFYDYNSDGVGVMYSENDSLVIEKILPKNEKAFIDFYHSHIAGKNCAFHLRMRTHGEIDLDNCHPYEVLNRADHGVDLWLMHNGILSTGNAADTKKSDTWHYIRDYLRPMLKNNPQFFKDPAFSALIGDHIGASNKFVLMDNAGHQVTINKSSGVYWGGLWLSNTYAWTASKNASKTEVTSSKKIKKQAAENVPQKYLAPLKSNWSGFQNFDNEWEVRPRHADNALLYEVESIYDQIADFGFNNAAAVSVAATMDFIEIYGEESWFDIAYMLIDGDIGEDWYIKVMTDHAAARECFPWLVNEAQKMGNYVYD